MAPKASAQNIDFSNVKDQGQFNPKQVDAGDYLATITKVEDSPAKDDTPMWVFTVKLERFSQNSYPYYCKLQENQLWKVRNLCIAGGLNVPKKRIKVDPNKLVGKQIGVTMEDDEYEGKMKSVIVAVFPAAELADGALVDTDTDDDDADDDTDDMDDVAEDTVEDDVEEEETEEEDEVEEDEEAEDEADEFTEMTRDQLKRWLRKNSEGYSIKKSQSDDDLREAARGIAGAGEAEEEAEEEAPAPKKKAAPAKKAPAKKAGKKAAAEVSDDELEELDIDDL